LDGKKPRIRIQDAAGNGGEWLPVDPPDQAAQVNDAVKDNGKHEPHHDDQGGKAGIDRLPYPEYKHRKQKTDIADEGRAAEHTEQTHGSKIQISDQNTIILLD
jgi:hypothetical protein